MKLSSQTVKSPPARPQTQVQSPAWEGPLEEGTTVHSSILAWRIPWPEDPGRLQSSGHRESDMMERPTLSLTFHTTGLLPLSIHLKNDLALLRVPTPSSTPPQGERNTSARAPETPQDAAQCPGPRQDAAQCPGPRQDSAQCQGPRQDSAPGTPQDAAQCPGPRQDSAPETLQDAAQCPGPRQAGSLLEACVLPY